MRTKKFLFLASFFLTSHLISPVSAVILTTILDNESNTINHLDGSEMSNGQPLPFGAGDVMRITGRQGVEDQSPAPICDLIFNPQTLSLSRIVVYKMGGTAELTYIDIDGYNIQNNITAHGNIGSVNVDGLVNGNINFGCIIGNAVLGDVNGSVYTGAVGEDLKTTSIGGDASLGTVGDDLKTTSVGDSASLGTVGEDLKTTSIGGDASLGILSGDLKTTSVDGNISLGNVTGNISLGNVDGRLTVINVGNDVSLGTVQGDLITNNINGNVTLEAVDGKLTTSNIDQNAALGSVGGNLTTGSIDGNASVGNTTGNLIIGGVQGTFNFNPQVIDTLLLKNFTGNINIKELEGQLNIGQQSGNVTISNFLGEAYIGLTGTNNSKITVEDNATKGTQHLITKGISNNFELENYGELNITNEAKVRKYINNHSTSEFQNYNELDLVENHPLAVIKKVFNHKRAIVNKHNLK